MSKEDLLTIENPTRASLRALRQGECRSGRGFPKSPVELTESPVGERQDQLSVLKEFGKRVPVLVPVVLSLIVSACEGRERNISISETPVGDFQSAVYSLGEEIPFLSPAPENLVETDLNVCPDSIYGVQLIPVKYINGFALEPKFQAGYENHGGEERLGLPISDQAGEINPEIFSVARQWFERGALSNDIVGGYPGEDLVANDGEIKRIPAAWKLFIYHEGIKEIPQPGDPEWVEPGDFQIDPRLEAIYEQTGGVNFLGIPLTPFIELGEDEGIQWTPFARLHYRNGQAWLDPVGKEYLEELCYPNPELLSSSLNPGFRYTPESVSQVDPAVALELELRAEDLVALISQKANDSYPINPRTGVYRDFWAYAFRTGKVGTDPRTVESVPTPTFERAYSILAAEKLENDLNPAIQHAAQELGGVMPAINEMLRENLDPILFNNNVVPQLPEEEILDSVIFGGGGFTYEGLGLPYHPMLLGRYYLKNPSPEGLGGYFIGQFMKFAPHSFLHVEKNQQLTGIDWSSPEGVFANELGSILGDMAVRMAGFEESDLPQSLAYPSLVYVYGVLKEGGVENPFSEMLNSMIAGSSDFYEEVRGNNLPFAEVFSRHDWRRLPPEVKGEIEEMDALYRNEFVNEYMRYGN